jgi:two-component system KDP operon response regulator KdpE
MSASLARPQTRILAISDEVQLHRLLRSILEPIGCEIVVATHSGAGLPLSDPPHIVVLDLDRLDPVAVSQAKDAFVDAEIIALCKDYREMDCVAVLEMGVEYLARPFRAQELTARVRAAQLRRLTARGYRRHYRHGSFAIDHLDWVVTRDGRRLSLTASELSVLAVLSHAPGHVATFGDILAGLGRPDSWSGRQRLHAFVVGLRGKIEEDAKRPVLILSEPRVGYRLAGEPSAPIAPGGSAPRPESD